MPIYEYACSKCGHEFEKLVRNGTVPECPSCHSTELEKKLSVFSAHGSSTGGGHVHTHAGPCGSCGHPDGPGACGLN